jgi:signal transduction histidine kinase
MTDRHHTRTRRGRIAGRLLWVLAALLGGATLVSAAAMIHDTVRQRTAASLVARATAEQVVALASERVTTAAVGHFGAVAQLPPALVATPGAVVTMLARAQRLVATTQQGGPLGPSSFFRLDLKTKRLDVARVAEDSSSRVPSSEVLTELAIAAADIARGPRHFAAHVAADSRLDEDAAFTSVDFDPNGDPIAVNGLIVPARRMAHLLFARAIIDAQVVDTAKGLVPLDTMSLEVRTADGRVIFGSIGPGNRFRQSVRPIGPLAGLSVEAGITMSQIPRAFVALAPRMELWHLGFLFACTVLVIVSAASAARRELALAKARSDFIAGVSHELRMPLAQILLAGETLTMQRERDVAERERLATSIVREAKRLIVLVENVLFFSRSGAVEFTPHLETVAVQSVFDDVVDAVQLAVDEAGQRLDVDAPFALAIIGDRLLVRQALVNLVDNALKYGKRGSRIRLIGEARGNAVRLCVDDEGPGIPEAERARVFEAYERLARDQASERTGSGLGLAIVRHIARSCGGDAWIEDAMPRGTRAVIELRGATLPTPAPETSGVA